LDRHARVVAGSAFVQASRAHPCTVDDTAFRGSPVVNPPFTGTPVDVAPVAAAAIVSSLGPVGGYQTRRGIGMMMADVQEKSGHTASLATQKTGVGIEGATKRR